MGRGREQSAQLCGLSDYCSDFTRTLDKRFATAVLRAKAMYPNWGKAELFGYKWLMSAADGQPNALEILNQRSIKINGRSFFGGNIGLNLHSKSVGIPVSHENGKCNQFYSVLDSC